MNTQQTREHQHNWQLVTHLDDVLRTIWGCHCGVFKLVYLSELASEEKEIKS